MKKLLVVLLSLGLIVAFSTAASAVDVKFSGGYYVVGVYDNNPELRKEGGYSRAAFFQRARVQTQFVVAEGLSLTTRFDALEKQWGQSDSRSMVAADVDKTNSRPYSTIPTTSSTTGLTNTAGKNLQENLEFERGFITFKTALAQFDVGYQIAGKWGTDFGDSECTKPRIKFATQAGPLSFLMLYEKNFEADSSSVGSNATGTTSLYRGKTDLDNDMYAVGAIYSFKGGQAGLLFKYVQNSMQRTLIATPYTTEVMGFVPYFKATVGPVYLEGEATYIKGKMKYDEGTVGVAGDIDLESWNAYLKAQVNMGPAYFGGQIGWVMGDGDGTATKMKNINGFSDAGYDWKPTLILNNVDYGTWIPNGKDSGNPYKNDPKGFLLYNVFAGVNPTPKLNVEAAVSFASYDKKKYWTNAARTTSAELVSADIGTEIDVTATYKIYDNLSYMVGAGYVFAGSAWKGTDPANTTLGGDTYMLLNKLTLSF